jgi:hypothetical protein
MCTVNITCITKTVHSAAVSDLAHSNNIDVFAVTYTYITPLTTSAELPDATPSGFTH